ncbi:unnamed protein product [Prunus armeniaca]
MKKTMPRGLKRAAANRSKVGGSWTHRKRGLGPTHHTQTHRRNTHPHSLRERPGKMTRGKQKIEAQKRNAEKNQKQKGSQFEARAVALKITCPICKKALEVTWVLIAVHGLQK